jgi:hypothetical protein
MSESGRADGLARPRATFRAADRLNRAAISQLTTVASPNV